MNFLQELQKSVTELLLDYKVDIAFISGEPKSDKLIVLKKIEEEIAILEPNSEIHQT